MGMKRRLGRTGPEVSAVGIGCWTIGGLVDREGDRKHGWYGTDDAESIRAVHRAVDLGVTFIDTADIYGIGHSERLLGKALKGRRDALVIATKFGKTFDETTGVRTDAHNEAPDYVRWACEQSLRRLQTDRIDLYQLHDGRMDLGLVDGLIETLEGLVAAGKIRSYGWSTDDPQRAAAFARGPNCIAVQHKLNVLEDAAEMVKLCEAKGLASINRSPLGQGLLTGKFDARSKFERFDVRARWNLASGRQAAQLRTLDRIRGLLASDGRSLVQGALGWILARSPATIPIPGFRSVAQVEDNCGVLDKGPLPASVMAAVERELAALASDAA
jgi:aryl-alcohol dehydrogenase-like predicted oxidoreductase